MLRTRFILIAFSLILLVGCSKSDITLFADEKYLSLFDKAHSPAQLLVRAAKEGGYSIKTHLVKVDTLEPNLTDQIKESSSKLIVLSPYLAKKIESYCDSFPDILFCSLESNGFANKKNQICLYRDRSSYFALLAKEVYKYQLGGLKVGMAFLQNESRRSEEKRIFTSELEKLNRNNFSLSDHPVYNSDNARSARDISSTMIREEVDCLLLFAASLNGFVMEEFPSENKIRVITESLYASDKVFSEWVFYSANYDYLPSMRTLISTFKNFNKSKSLEPSELNIPIGVYKEKIGNPLSVEFDEKADLFDDISEGSEENEENLEDLNLEDANSEEPQADEGVSNKIESEDKIKAETKTDLEVETEANN